MKITIDTKEDSHDEIKKIIRMLSSLVDGEVLSNKSDMFSDKKNTQSSDIFNDDTSKTDDSGSSGGGIFNMFNSGSGSDASAETVTKETQEKKEENENVDVNIPDVEEYH